MTREMNFKIETPISNELIIRLDDLPVEIIYLIFEYLSSNDILYAFFFLNQRFKNILLENQSHINHMEFPIKDLYTWKRILSIIKNENITSIDFSFPLTYFPNLKSISISAPYRIEWQQLKMIFDNKYFTQLHSLKIKEKYINLNLSNDRSLLNLDAFTKVLNTKSSLKIFHCSLSLISYGLWMEHMCGRNSNLRSWALFLNGFSEIFLIISFTPNLEYLHIKSSESIQYDFIDVYRARTHISNEKLKKLYFELSNCRTSKPIYDSVDLGDLFYCIERISSSLICLSIDLSDGNVKDSDAIPFNSTKLQRFLKSMIHLKQFHLYTKLDNKPTDIDKKNILLGFQNQYWFDHQLYFGMHDRYLYTLPFHSYYLHEFYGDFNDVQSSNHQILLNNPRMWYNVKSIDIRHPLTYDFSFFKELNIKMPKLICINFDGLDGHDPQLIGNSWEDIDEEEMVFNNVRRITWPNKYIESAKQWIICFLPNLNHLTFSDIDLVLSENFLTEILNKRIEQLDLEGNSLSGQLTEIKELNYSNVEHLCLKLSDRHVYYNNQYPIILMKILKNCKNLQTLIVYKFQLNKYFFQLTKEELNTVMNDSEMEHVNKNYQMKQFPDWILFSKKESWDENENISDGRSPSRWQKFLNFFQKKK
jgi:hypothetical protein